MSGMGYQMVGFVSSVLATCFMIPTVRGWLRDAMPSAKMRVLDAVLSETEGLLRSAMEEGTIDYDHYDRYFRNRIWVAKGCADDCRAEVYSIRSGWQELVHWFGGLSRNIATVTDSICILRGHIAVSSSRGRQRLARLGQTGNPALEKYARRETLSILTLPDPPAGVACTLKPCTFDDMTTVPHDTATMPPPEYLLNDSAPSTLRHSAAPLTAELPAYEGRVNVRQSHALPPLAFRSKEKATFGARRIERVVLHRSDKHSAGLDGALSLPFPPPPTS
ncbi:hypothetical protein C8T65DRAFT_836245 [Cerioporus squamosus]|nr:hypothetical protein C8T65DRAFT_836245 [Cerioporus squamosus]